MMAPLGEQFTIQGRGGTGSASGLVTPGAGSSGFTAGSIIFADATGALNQDNAKLFWDDTNFRQQVVGAHRITGQIGGAALTGNMAGQPVGRTDAGLEIAFGSAGAGGLVSLVSTLNPGTLVPECAYVFSAFDAAGTMAEQGSVSGAWFSAVGGTARGVVRIGASTASGSAINADVRVIGGGGIVLFGTNSAIDASGPNILRIFGREISESAGLLISGTFFEVQRIGNVGQSLSVLLGFDTGASSAVVAANGASGILQFVTHDGTAWGPRLSINSTGQVVVQDAKNIVLGTGTGTQFGTAVAQKLAFHGSAPVVQRAGAAQAAMATTGSTNVTPFGFTTAAQADNIPTLLNEIRAALVEKGIIKGAA